MIYKQASPDGSIGAAVPDGSIGAAVPDVGTTDGVRSVVGCIATGAIQTIIIVITCVHE